MKVYALCADAGSLIGEGLINMAIGLSVVFAVLILLCLIIWAFKFIGKLAGEEPGAPAPKAPAKAPAPAAPAVSAAKGPGSMAEGELNIDGDVEADAAAAILGAVAQECGGNFKVTSIKKSK